MKTALNQCYMVMQNPSHQLFTEDVLDEVLLSMEDNEEEQRPLAERILSELDLLPFAERHPMSLSGGQQQRVAIASAVASGREIMVFDEPTSGLDFRHMEEVAKILTKLQQMGKTLFIITHDPELIEKCCDYFIFIEKGTVNSDMLARMRQQNIKEVNKDDLVDIRSVFVDTSLPPEQRMMDYLEKVKNPYCFRCGEAVVSIHFAAGGASLESLLKNYFSGLKKG